MFRGLHTLSIDGKGRLAIPARYRETLLDQCAGRMVLTINPDEPCLWLYPLPEWERIETSLNNLPRSDKYGLRLRRLLMRYASDCSLDSAGRILVPGMLREFAQLEKPTVLFGMSNKFEVWSSDNWTRNEAELLAEEIDEAEASEASMNLVL